MRSARLVILSGVFIAVAISGWAVPSTGAAHQPFHLTNTLAVPGPGPVSFREARGRGLLVNAWINGRGPFSLAIDTGAGLTLISAATARQAGISSQGNGSKVIAGLSGREVAVRKAVIDKLSLGWSGNVMPRQIPIAIAPDLPAGVDGILDPTEAYAPFGYVIDYPAKLITTFDSTSSSLDPRYPAAGGAIVRWHRDGQSGRPFVKLGDGRLALIDTGSDFGLAVSQPKRNVRYQRRSANDVGGGTIHATRVAPTTVNIGSLVLEEVPTDVLDGIEKGAPVILGRDALYPFRLTFDPVRRLIAIAPGDPDE